MADTYSNDPSASPKDAVRFLIHDTESPWLFSDEEIQYMLSTEGSVYSAAAELAVVQSTKYTDRADKTVGPLSIRYGDLANRWLALAKSLRSRGGAQGGVFAVMTQSHVGHYFRLGGMDNRMICDKSKEDWVEPSSEFNDPEVGGWH